MLQTLRVLTAWFAVLVLVFAALDPWLLPSPDTPPEYRPSSAKIVAAAGLAAIVGVMLGATALWLRFWPPPLRWANSVALGVGLMGLTRAVSYVVVSPELFRVQTLAILVIAAGCVLLSRRIFVGFTILSVVLWYAAAYLIAPNVDWHRTAGLTAAAVAVSAAVMTVRRRSHDASFAAQQFDQRIKQELAERARLGELLGEISTRFVTDGGDHFDRVVEETLRDLGKTLRADHAFICRLEWQPIRTSMVYEWVGPEIVPRGPLLQNAPLDDLPWFCHRLMTGEATNIPDRALLPPEAIAEQGSLQRLGAVAFLAVPLPRGRATPWGYFGLVNDTHPTIWSRDEVNLLRVVGDLFLTTLERRQAEEAVRQSELRFRRLFDSNIIGVVFANVYGTIVDANNAFFSLTGYDRQDLPLRWNALTPSDWRAHDEAAILRLLKYGADPPWEKEYLCKDGRRVPVLIGGAMLSHKHGECVHFVLDLSERKEAERKVQRLNSELMRAARLGVMGEIAAGIAHEVHQPLAAIANYANGARRRLERGRLDENDLTELFGEIVAQCKRAGTVIHNIRDFVRDRRPSRHPVDLNALVNECLQLVRFDIRQRNVEITVELAEGLPAIHADATQISQILINLILNAAQAMESSCGPRRILIRTAAEGDCIVASVRDTGPGVVEEARTRLFDQFYTTKPTGLGMGLSLSRSIAESHGGSLEMIDTGPQGTEFLLRLPAALRPSGTASALASPVETTKLRAGSGPVTP